MKWKQTLLALTVITIPAFLLSLWMVAPVSGIPQESVPAAVNIADGTTLDSQGYLRIPIGQLITTIFATITMIGALNVFIGKWIVRPVLTEEMGKLMTQIEAKFVTKTVYDTFKEGVDRDLERLLDRG